jgi:hypothetical protein
MYVSKVRSISISGGTSSSSIVVVVITATDTGPRQVGWEGGGGTDLMVQMIMGQ